MIGHYFKIAFRNFAKDKGYSVINLVGLALAVACSFLFVLWVQYENNYESTHVHRNRIYRVLTTENMGGAIVKQSHTPGPLAEALKSEFPVIANATFLNVDPVPGVIVCNEQPYSAIRGEAGSSFFEVFTFEFLHGSPQTAFEGDRPIVISEDLAMKMFGNSSDIVGQPLYERTRLWENFRSDPPYIITAVVRIPKNTHIRFDALINAEKTSHHGFAYNSWKGRNHYTTFVQMAPKATFNNDIRTLMANYLTKHLPDDKRKLVFQPLTDIHLHSDVVDANLMGEFGEPRYIFIFLTMALFVLAIAVINHLNLSIARGANRSREVGIRKVGGACRHELVLQFLVESMLWSFASMILALLLAELIIPWFSNVVGASLTIDYSFRTVVTALALALVVGLLAGSYSAFYLTSFHPALILKGGTSTGSRSVLRKTLLAVQLAISIFIMLCTGVVYKQLHYIQNKDIGFDRYNVIGINTSLWYRIENDFKREVLKNANVEAVTIAAYSPIDMNWGTVLQWDGNDSETNESCNMIFADWDYAKVFRLQMIQGDFLPENMGWWGETPDISNAVVVNEAAAKIMGETDIIGKGVTTGKVVGVIKDFNFRSFHEKITPLIIRYNPETTGKVFIRISPYNQKATIDYIREVFQTVKKDNPFEYFYMEDEYSAMYQKEFRLGRVFLYFSLLSIFISCMGVFSLVAFMVQYRSKEIGIRKINGAEAGDILLLFVREFTTLTSIAFVVASPFAWFAMYRWLQNYQYRISIGLWVFIAVLALIWILTMLTLLVQVYKAARRNPVESLKFE